MQTNRFRRRLALTLCTAMALCAGLAARAGAAGPERITIDTQAVSGGFRDLQGVSGIPGAAPGALTEHLGDVTPLWQAAHVRYVRTYDWVSRLDTRDNPDSLFPRWAADPDDPASYNFAATDVWMRAMQRLGIEVDFDLSNDIPHNRQPAEDVAKYERVVEHVIRHYAKGWAGGLQGGIGDVEFGDEPDLGDLHFRGTPEQFYAMYAAVTRAVKRVDPALRVGAPGLAFPLNPQTPYREGLLDYVKQHGIPLDFYSFKVFADGTRDPMDMAAASRQMRQFLDARGMPKTEVVMASWNLTALPWARTDPQTAAAFQTAAAIYMQDSPLFRAVFFRADMGHDAHYGFLDPDRIFDEHGQPDVRAMAFTYVGKTLAMDRRLKVQGGDESGFAVLAGRSGDGKVTRIVMTNYAIPAEALAPRKSDRFNFTLHIPGTKAQTIGFVQPPQRQDAASAGKTGYDLTVTGLSGPYTVTRHFVGGGQTTEQVETSHGQGAAHIAADLPAQGVAFVEIATDGRAGQ